MEDPSQIENYSSHLLKISRKKYFNLGEHPLISQFQPRSNFQKNIFAVVIIAIHRLDYLHRY